MLIHLLAHLLCTLSLASCLPSLARTGTDNDAKRPTLALGSCESMLDCWGNGDCVQGQCVCDPAWSGSPVCNVMAFQPAPEAGAYHNSTEASWGGNVVLVDGLYHLFVAQFVNECPLAYWGTNSAIIRATSTSPLGPFIFQVEINFGWVRLFERKLRREMKKKYIKKKKERKERERERERE